MSGVLYLATVAELLMYAVAPIAALLAVLYVCTRRRAIDLVFYAALSVVALCNLIMLAAGSWHLAMINPYLSDRADPYERLFLPATAVVYLAPFVKGLIDLLKVRKPDDPAHPLPD